MSGHEALVAEFRLFAAQWGGAPEPGKSRDATWRPAHVGSKRDLFDRVLAVLEGK